MPSRVDTKRLDELCQLIEKEDGWRVETDPTGKRVAYAPNGESIVPLMAIVADARVFKNTLTNLATAGLDVRESFATGRTRAKAERRAEVKVPRQPRVRGEAVPRKPLRPATALKMGADWFFTQHANERMAERRVTHAEVLGAVLRPQIERQSAETEGVLIRQLGQIKAVVDPERKLVITVALPEEIIEAKEISTARAMQAIAGARVAQPSPAMTGEAKAQDVAVWAQRLKEEYLHCRDFGHTWQPFRAWWDTDDRLFVEVIRCRRCKANTTRHLNRSGHVMTRNTSYPDGYLAPDGTGRLTLDNKDSLRLVTVTRLIASQDGAS